MSPVPKASQAIPNLASASLPTNKPATELSSQASAVVRSIWCYHELTCTATHSRKSGACQAKENGNIIVLANQ